MTSPTTEPNRWAGFNYLELQLLIASMETRDVVLKEMITEAKKEISSRSHVTGTQVQEENKP